MQIREALAALVKKNNLNFDQMRTVTEDIMSGKVSDSQIGAFLVALRMKGETVEEIAAAATVMRQFATKVEINSSPILDTAGTGGDGSHSFNISTACAFVAASAGINIAKHGNRAASGSTGSADLLEAAGAKIDLEPRQVISCMNSLQIGFMFAPAHHKATRYVFGPRREIGIRTIFNFLGPLTNPANASRQLIGVYDSSWIEKIAQVLKELGCEKALVVCSSNGMDEIAIDCPTNVAELSDGAIETFEVSPELFGIPRQSHDQLVANSPEASLKIIKDVFKGIRGPAFDIVSLNAGAAIYLGGQAKTIGDGVGRASELLETRSVLTLFDKFCQFTQTLGNVKD